MRAQGTVEKCGKVWRQEPETAARHDARDGVYLLPGARAASEMRACSACAGDYEDPERTAWTPDDAEEDESGGAQRGGTDEFPAEE